MSTPTTFHALGHTWTKHNTGDGCPCDGDKKVLVCFKDGTDSGTSSMAAEWCEWDNPAESEEIIGWRFPDSTPPQEKDELTQLRIKLEDAETAMEDIASDVAEFAADGDSPNAGPRDRLAAKVFSHISAHRASAPDSKLSWKDKQVAGLEESLRAAKERMLKDEAELTRLREAIKEGFSFA